MTTTTNILVALASIGRVDIDAKGGFTVAIDSPVSFNTVAQLIPSMSAPIPGYGETYACGWLAGHPVRVSLGGGCGVNGVDGWQAAAWMQTYTGRAFRPWVAEIEDIDPLDIARSLSMTCRYNGHVKRFYSVAEHCVLMSRAFEDRDLALWALLHDAAEAYIGDMVRPLKITDAMGEYRWLDRQLTALIAMRWGLPHATGLLPVAVKDADNRILLDERAVLLGDPAEPWHQDANGTQPLGVDIQAWAPLTAESEYLVRLDELVTA